MCLHSTPVRSFACVSTASVAALAGGGLRPLALQRQRSTYAICASLFSLSPAALAGYDKDMFLYSLVAGNYSAGLCNVVRPAARARSTQASQLHTCVHSRAVHVAGCMQRGRT